MSDSNWIISHFADSGVPKTGLSPIITIIDLATDSVVVNGASMSEVANGTYKYNFITLDPKNDYSISVDGGNLLSDVDRYQASTNESYNGDIRKHLTNKQTITKIDDNNSTHIVFADDGISADSSYAYSKSGNTETRNPI